MNCLSFCEREDMRFLCQALEPPLLVLPKRNFWSTRKYLNCFTEVKSIYLPLLEIATAFEREDTKLIDHSNFNLYSQVLTVFQEHSQVQDRTSTIPLQVMFIISYILLVGLDKFTIQTENWQSGHQSCSQRRQTSF